MRHLMFDIDDCVVGEWERRGYGEYAVRLNAITRTRELDPYHIDARYHYEPEHPGANENGMVYTHLPALTAFPLRWGTLRVQTDNAMPDNQAELTLREGVGITLYASR